MADVPIVVNLDNPDDGVILSRGHVAPKANPIFTGTVTIPDGTAATHAVSKGQLDTHAADTTAVHGITDTAALVVTTDTRLTDARTPVSHAATHTDGGSDEITVAIAQVTGLGADLSAKDAALSAHSGASTAVHGITNTADLVVTNDPRLSNARTPVAHVHAEAEITGLVADLGLKAPLASPTFTGDPKAPTAAKADNDTSIATTAHVKSVVADYAPLASPALTGSPTAPTPAAGDNDTSIATTAFAAERAAMGNLLTANQASGTDALGNTTGFTFSNATGASSAAEYLSGARSLAVTALGGSAHAQAYGSTSSGSMPVIAGAPYTLRGMVKSSVAINAQVIVYWFTSAGNVAASTASATSPSVTTATSWREVAVTAVAPSNAAFASFRLSALSPTIGDVFYWDNLGFWAGAGGEWAMPGTPIVNLGHKVTHPNVDDVLVQKWDSGLGRWQTVHYDSGWRELKTGIVPTPANLVVSVLRMRRIGKTVNVMYDLTSVTTFGEVQLFGSGMASPLPLPQGFRFMPYAETSPAPFDFFASPAFGATPPVTWRVSNYQDWMKVSIPNPAYTRYYGIFEYLCDTAIPTSLPGTLVSAAPA